MLVSYEGPDTSGKTTQIEISEKYLKNNGYKVETLHFPNYNSSLGEFIQKVLNSKGMFEELNPLTFQYLYIADQLNHKEHIEKALDRNDFVILDRYDLSTIVYAMSSVSSQFSSNLKSNRVKIANTVLSAQQPLIKPDVTFIFDLDPMQITKRKEIHDNFEKNLDFIKDVCILYENIEDYINLNREILHVNANKSINEVSQFIIDGIEKYAKLDRCY